MISLPSFPPEWGTATIGDLFEVQQGKAMSMRAREGENQRPFLRTANVLWGQLDLAVVDRMSFDDDEAQRLELRDGDLLTCEGGEVGRTAIWRNQLPGCLFQNHVLRLRAKSPDTCPEFFMYWLREAFTHLHVYAGAANRTTIPNLSSGRLKALTVPAPPPLEQREIAFILTGLQNALATKRRGVVCFEELQTSISSKILCEGMRNESMGRLSG